MKIEIKHRFTSEVIFSCEAENIGIAVKLAIEAKADLRSANLRSADLSSANLRSADLSSADLSSADLSSADLSSADLRSADLRSADLRFADLSSADLRSADLRSANLRSANLRFADLRSANLRSANLRFADLDYTNIPMWCGTLVGVKVDFRLICQMLLHIFALECDDPKFKLVKKVIGKYARLSEKWHYFADKHAEAK